MPLLIKILIVLFIFIPITACAATKVKINDHVGEINAQQLLTTFTTFSHSYYSYEVSNHQMSQVKLLPHGLVIDVYFATWCHDSQREVPRLLKALINRPDININLIGLDENKRDLKGRAKKAGIKFTPTFIVLLNDKELGRIIERPQVDLVSDIISFIKAN